MTERRVVVPSVVLCAGKVHLPSDVAHYVRDVLRLGVGHPVTLLDGCGRVGSARVAAVTRTVVEVDVKSIEVETKSGPELTMWIALIKGAKVNTLVRMLAEIGATRVVFLRTERAIPENSARADHWQTIADDAMRVSGRTHRMRIEPTTSLGDALATPRMHASLCPDVHADHAWTPRTFGRHEAASVEVLIGPEGGFSESERSAIDDAGFFRIRLGPNTLRADTAAIVVASLIMCGDHTR